MEGEGSNSFFQLYFNADDAWLPLIGPFIFWSSCWFYCSRIGRDFFEWHQLHLGHHYGAMVLAAFSLYYQDESIFAERIVILWSLAYFIVDVVYTIVYRKYDYIFHGLVCLGLGLANFNIPLLYHLRMNSKATYLELSTPILYTAKKSRDPKTFGLFALAFTCCRIVYIPLGLVRPLLNASPDVAVGDGDDSETANTEKDKPETITWSHPVVIALLLFYILQIYWWLKIIRIIIKGLRNGGKESGTEEKGQDAKESSLGAEDTNNAPSTPATKKKEN